VNKLVFKYVIIYEDFCFVIKGKIYWNYGIKDIIKTIRSEVRNA
jgi:hypothetical protein